MYDRQFISFWLTLLFVFTFLGINTTIEAKEIVADPKPTHIPKQFSKLELITEIKEDINDTTFMARPMSMCVSKAGEIFVFDSGVVKIFKFDNQFRFVKTFGNQGQGPSEFNGNEPGHEKLYYGEDGNIYACSGLNRRIIVFDSDGNHIKDIKTPPVDRFPGSYLPVVCKKGNIYVYSKHGGAVDVYNHKMELVHTLLEKRHFDRFLFSEPNIKIPKIARLRGFDPRYISAYGSVFYNLLSDGRVLIYLSNGSTVFVIKNGGIENRFDVWLKGPLERKKKSVERINANKKFRNSSYPMVTGLILDRDEPEYFYIQFNHELDRLYKFNVDGHLKEVLVSDTTTYFMAKRNGLFYALFKGRFQTNIQVFKPVRIKTPEGLK